jgi:hypothetical protein
VVLHQRQYKFFLLLKQKELYDEKQTTEKKQHLQHQHDNFPTKTYPVDVGDVVFFPSSVFHRTIPFASKEERICIAFDVKPQIV